MSNVSATTQNLSCVGECVLNLVSAGMVEAVDRLALTTGVAEPPAYRAEMGYRHVADKWAVSGLTPSPSHVVGPDRVLEAPIQLEAVVVAQHPFVNEAAEATAFQLRVIRAHVHDDVRVPGSHHVDAGAWKPLIMKFCDFYTTTPRLAPSALAAAWQMPPGVERRDEAQMT